MERQIKISSQIANISIVENLIDEISIDLALVADAYGNVLIGVIEAVTNAIVHGNLSDTNKMVTVTISQSNRQLIIRVDDEGSGFNYDGVPDPTKPGNVEKPDGRGVFLMKHLADEVVFERGGASVILKFNIT